MEALLNGLGTVITPYHILLLLFGVTLGAVMGCIPGLTGLMAITLLILLALTMVGSVAGDSMIKGLICGFFGILLSTVGMDPLATVSRFSFNNLNLMTGLGNIPVLIGLLLKYFAKVANAPKSVIFPFVMMSCCIGVYAVSQNSFDVWVLLVFSAIGYLMMKFGFPTTPTLVGFLLGETFERNLRQALLISKNDFSFFFSSKIDWILWIAIVISIVSIARSKRKKQPIYENQPNRQEDEDGV